MITVIVPIHNQGKHIRDIVNAYEKQSVVPDELVFVLDRCTDDSEDILGQIQSSIQLFWYTKDYGEGHQAGAVRDFGLSFHPNSEFYIFTDGDCLPSVDLVRYHVETMRYPKPIISVGQRNYYDQNGKKEMDIRYSFVKDLFDDNNGKIILNNRFGIDVAITYTCNLGMNREAIKLCKESNKRLVNSERVFNPLFDNIWGGEDNFIGTQVFCLGGYISICHKDCYVDHIWHEPSKFRSSTAYKNLKILKNMLIRTLDDPDEIEKRRNIPGLTDNEVPFNVNRILRRSEETTKLLRFFKYKDSEEEICYRSYLSRNFRLVETKIDNGKYNGRLNTDSMSIISDDISQTIFKLDENGELYFFGRTNHWRSLNE